MILSCIKPNTKGKFDPANKGGGICYLFKLCTSAHLIRLSIM